MVAAAAVSAVASIGGAVIQSNAASSAAKKQAGAADRATAAQQNMFDTTQENVQPFIHSGTAASKKLEGLEGLNGGDNSTIMNTLTGLPGYQFAEQQGLKSVQNSATARGLGISGAAQKGASSYSTGLANQYYNNLLGGVQNTANMGSNAASGLANTSATVGGNIANTMVGAGNAQAAGILGSANAAAGGITGAANGLQNAFYANKILGGMNGGPGGLYGQQIAENGMTNGENQFLSNADISAFGEG